MPHYEMSLLLKSMSRAGLTSTVKRISESILDQGGYIRKIESLGTRDLPYRMSCHGYIQNKGSYWVLRFDSPSDSIAELKDNCLRDIDVIRPFIFKVQEPKHIECTLGEEIKPPAYRSEVQKMIEESKNRQPINIRKRPKPNSGLDYYPFSM